MCSTSTSVALSVAGASFRCQASTSKGDYQGEMNDEIFNKKFNQILTTNLLAYSGGDRQAIK
jgi:hypothetical protein